MCVICANNIRSSLLRLNFPHVFIGFYNVKPGGTGELQIGPYQGPVLVGVDLR